MISQQMFAAKIVKNFKIARFCLRQGFKLYNSCLFVNRSFYAVSVPNIGVNPDLEKIRFCE
jgi:hypothetical protein